MLRRVDVLSSAAMVLLIIAGFGCEGSPSAADATDPDRAIRVRQQLQQSDPNAIVGFVTAVVAEERFAAVGDVPIERFENLEGTEAFTFLNDHQDVLAHGIAFRVVGDTVHVRYDSPPDGGRTPRVGDLAVHFE